MPAELLDEGANQGFPVAVVLFAPDLVQQGIVGRYPSRVDRESAQQIEFDGKQDLRTKVMIALFGLFAEVERDLISERTKEGLAAAKAKGKLLGRPKGALGKSKLDGKEQDIRALLDKDVSKSSIAKILNVSRSALYHFIETRKIAPG